MNSAHISRRLLKIYVNLGGCGTVVGGLTDCFCKLSPPRLDNRGRKPLVQGEKRADKHAEDARKI